MKRSVSLGLVLALVLTLLTAVSAVAAGIVLSHQVDDELLAAQALESAYGVTPTMQGSYFGKTVEANEGSTTVTYWGTGDLRYVLGEYTVTVRDGKASVTWSHDGESTAGGFEAEAWGIDQLNAMVAWSQAHHDVSGYYGQAMEIAQRHGAARENGRPSDGEIAALQAGYAAQSEQAQAAAKWKEQDMIALARQAVAVVFQLTEEQMALVRSPQDIYEPWEYYSLRDGKPVYSVWLYLTQRPSDRPDEFPAFTEGDGIYVVDVNVETGVIESIHYDADLGSNG
ncbi:MAG: hypothetical protein IJ662_13995 [Clostridia bacterium]|nr:hypothetical protein [Clostridia bacterium]